MSAYTHELAPRAKEPTPEEAKERREGMYQLDQRIKSAFRKGREALWEAAQAMHEFDEENGWTSIGYEKLNDWLADPEVGMTYRTWRRTITTYRDTVLQRQIDFEEVKQLEFSKVDIVLSKVRTGEKPIEEALSDAATLGNRDLRELYYDRPDTPATGGSDDTKPPLPPDGDPVDASEVEPGDEPDPDPDEHDLQRAREEQHHRDELDDLIENGDAEPEVVEKPERLEKAKQTLSQIDLGLNGVSDAARLNGLRCAREFLLSDYPSLDPEGAA